MRIKYGKRRIIKRKKGIRRFKKIVPKKYKRYVKKQIDKFTPVATVNWSYQTQYNVPTGSGQVNTYILNDVFSYSSTTPGDYLLGSGGATGTLYLPSTRIRIKKHTMRFWLNYMPANDSDNVIAYRFLIVTNPPNWTATLQYTNPASEALEVLDAAGYFNNSGFSAYFGSQITTGQPNTLLTADVDDRFARVLFQRMGYLNPTANTHNNSKFFYWHGRNCPKIMTTPLTTSVVTQGTVWLIVMFVGKEVEVMTSGPTLTTRGYIQAKAVASKQYET